MRTNHGLRGALAPEPWRPEPSRREEALRPHRGEGRSPYLRQRWTGGQIGGRTFKGALLLLGVVLLYLLLLGDAGWIRQTQLQNRRSALVAEIQRLEAKSAALESEARRLEQDPAYRERIAREEWGYKRTDEVVYHLRRLE
ncbi:septum formation initiator family protein [bacterium]|nr:septum formation initiator family protein [bacterium]